MSEIKISVPADVPEAKEVEYLKNMQLVTHGKGRIMLFAGDQKMEHLNDDFFGDEVSLEDSEPEHLFKIASNARISCFAAQIGLIARYGKQYPNIPYVIKLNSKSNLVKVADHDPLSLEWVNVEQVMQFKETSGLNICGVGYTLFLGSEYEAQMLTEISQAILDAHSQGLFFILWVYPRGKSVPNELDPHIIAGAAGAANVLGADFVKVNYPKRTSDVEAKKRAEDFKEAIAAAGNTKVICSGGSKMAVPDFLQQLWDQIHISGASGNATGRNIHERSLEEAVRFANAIFAVTMEDASVQEAMKIYQAKT